MANWIKELTDVQAYKEVRVALNTDFDKLVYKEAISEIEMGGYALSDSFFKQLAEKAIIFKMNSDKARVREVGERLLFWAHPTANFEEVKVVDATIIDFSKDEVEYVFQVDWISAWNDNPGYTVIRVNPDTDVLECIKDTAVIKCGTAVNFLKDVLEIE